SLPMVEGMFEGEKSTSSATGPPGPIPRKVYCNSGCYDSKERGTSKSCSCDGCKGKAHGKGKEFASKLGCLKPPSYSRESQPYERWLILDARPDPIEEAGQPYSNIYICH
ncbi:MAG: hypothetical protein WAL75_15295, partial [Terracidiphilus sp.]